MGKTAASASCLVRHSLPVPENSGRAAFSCIQLPNEKEDSAQNGAHGDISVLVVVALVAAAAVAEPTLKFAQLICVYISETGKTSCGCFH